MILEADLQLLVLKQREGLLVKTDRDVSEALASIYTRRPVRTAEIWKKNSLTAFVKVTLK